MRPHTGSEASFNRFFVPLKESDHNQPEIGNGSLFKDLSQRGENKSERQSCYLLYPCIPLFAFTTNVKLPRFRQIIRKIENRLHLSYFKDFNTNI